MFKRDRMYEDDALRCRGCGYDLSGLRIGDKCPECAARIETSLPPLPRNGHAVGGLVSLAWAIGHL